MLLIKYIIFFWIRSYLILYCICAQITFVLAHTSIRPIHKWDPIIDGWAGPSIKRANGQPIHHLLLSHFGPFAIALSTPSLSPFLLPVYHTPLPLPLPLFSSLLFPVVAFFLITPRHISLLSYFLLLTRSFASRHLTGYNTIRCRSGVV